MSRLVSHCNPIGVKDADFADIGFMEDVDIGDLEGVIGKERRLDLRFIFGLISQTDEAIIPSAKNAQGRWSRNLRVSRIAGETFIDELGLNWPVYCPLCDPCGEAEKMMVMAGRSVIGEVEVNKGLVIGRMTTKKDPNKTIAYMTYNLFYVCTSPRCGSVFPIFFRDAEDKEALKTTGFLKKSDKTEFRGTCAFCGYYGQFDQYPMTNVGNLIWEKKFISKKDLGELPRDEIDIRYDWAVVCPKCRVLFPTSRNEMGEHDTNRYKKALVTKPVPRVYQKRHCPVCDHKRKGAPLKVGMNLDMGNITHKTTGQRFANLYLDSFYVCDNKAGLCESIFTLYPLEFLDYL
ncbi:MAG: hypothetical protein JSV56_04920 [Methanomassiliicoccales archaeon]|nr:MAG: hypothetical protein JSV56_04920 [Methanomassiliicoccales archaeon]